MARFANRDTAGAYLAAMIDGEGYIPKQTARGHGHSIEIANTEEDIIAATAEACDVLKIAYRIQSKPAATENRRAAYVLRIGAIDNLVRVQKLVPIQSARKRGNLDGILANYIKNTPLPMIEELMAMYQSGLSASAIAKRYGVAGHAIAKRLKRAGVCLRGVGEATILAHRGKHFPTATRPSPVFLRSEYWDKGLSAHQIGRTLGVSANTIRRWMRQMNIDRRTNRDGLRNIWADGGWQGYRNRSPRVEEIGNVS